MKVDLFEGGTRPDYQSALLRYSSAECTSRSDQLPLLHESTRPEAWRHWFALAGCADFTPVPGMHFEMYGMVIEAARAGLGVGLVPRFYGAGRNRTQ
ncbi:hypothetical protein ACU4GD_31675 [Cupriavidus basilensis]